MRKLIAWAFMYSQELARVGARPPSVAHHLAHTAAPGDADSAAVLRAAAAIVRPRAPAIAADVGGQHHPVTRPQTEFLQVLCHDEIARRQAPARPPEPEQPR